MPFQGDSGGPDQTDGGTQTDGGMQTDGGTTTEDGDGDGYSSDEDCDDADPAVFPGAFEHCDGIDNDCDAEIDEPLTWSFSDLVDAGVLELNGDARLSGDALLLTDGGDQAGAAWLTQPIAGDAWAIALSVEVLAGSDPAGDGLTVAWQVGLDGAYLGASGDQLGVYGLVGHAVELDSYESTIYDDLPGEHISVV